MTDVILDTIPALYSACLASLDLADVKVIDGPVVKKGSERQRLFIGASDDGSGISAEGENPPDILPGVVNFETFVVLCVAETWGGSTDLTVIRQQVFAIRDVVKGLIRPSSTNLTLGVAAIQSAHMGAWQLTQIQDEQGAYCRIAFRTEFVARPSTT